MSPAEVHNAYPHHHRDTYNEHSKVLVEHYKHGGLSVSYCCGKHPRHAFSIATISAEFVTNKGIGVGDSLQRLKQAYPAVQCYDDGTGDIVSCRYQKPTTVKSTDFNIEPTDKVIDGIQVTDGQFYSP